MDNATLDPDALVEGIETNREVVHAQLRASERYLERTDALTRLALAEAGGIGAFLGFLLARSLQVGPGVLMALLASVCMNFIGLITLAGLSTGAGVRADVKTGPSPQEVEAAIMGSRVHVIEFRASLLRSLAHITTMNDEELHRRKRLLSAGLGSLVAAGILLLGSVAYIAGAVMLD